MQATSLRQWSIFEAARQKVTGGWIKSHNEEIHNLYPSPNIFTEIKSGGCDEWGI
jgi:hypothetical protein